MDVTFHMTCEHIVTDGQSIPTLTSRTSPPTAAHRTSQLPQKYCTSHHQLQETFHKVEKMGPEPQ